MQKRHLDEYENFPKLYASLMELDDEFTSEKHKKEFEEDMKLLGLKPDEKDKLIKVMPFTYIRENQLSEYNAMMERMDKEFLNAIEEDRTGEGFIKYMFRSGILEVGSNTDIILNSLGISKEYFEKNDNLKRRIRTC